MDQINRIIEPMLGQSAWNVQLGIGSFITFEFGKPISISKSRTRGEWLLWIRGYAWFIEHHKKSIIGSEDSREILKEKVSVFTGHKLSKVSISPSAFETNFIFDDELILRIFPLNIIDNPDMWMLFTPEKKVLVLYSTGLWSYESAEKA